MDGLNGLNRIVWNEQFWLPNNFTWDEIHKYTNFSVTYTLFYPISLAFLVYLVRVCFEKFVATPIANCLNIKEEKSIVNFKHNPKLEVYFKDRHVTFSESIYLHLSRETGLTVEYIKEWFALRRYMSKPTLLKKFTESCWRFFFYLSIWSYGAYIMYQKSWLWDTRHCWINYPKHKIDDDIYWYYIIELAFYFSLLVTQFFDIKRKDFWQMFLHHIVTISLLLFSYMCNFTRLGTLVLLVHDCADFWLELSKMAMYAKLKKFCDTCFSVFTITWFFTRITFFPLKILNSTTYEAPELMGLFPAYYLFNILLYTLQVMHVIWFYMIVRIAWRAITVGKVEKDDRSESDDDDLEKRE